MHENGLYTFSDVALMLGVSRITISDLSGRYGITPKKMTNGKAKGLDKADIRVLAKLLKVTPNGEHPGLRERVFKVTKSRKRSRSTV